ncbi:MAG: hypothetical protein AB1553_13515 [Nitrospirota bacterium]
MSKRLLIAVLAAIMLFAGLPVAMAMHPGGDVVLKDSAGTPITDGVTPYSPKQTCGTCHNYGSGEKHSIHTQAVLESDGKLHWQSYDVKSFEHGVSVGRHSNQGRNEDYSNKFRSKYGLPWFTSSPGMFGKF